MQRRSKRQRPFIPREDESEFKLFVGNIHPGIVQDELQEYFEAQGDLLACDLMIDKQTGRSRGFAFIQFGSREGMRRALKAMDGKELEGKQLSVKEARPREFRPRPGYRR